METKTKRKTTNVLSKTTEEKFKDLLTFLYHKSYVQNQDKFISTEIFSNFTEYNLDDIRKNKQINEKLKKKILEGKKITIQSFFNIGDNFNKILLAKHKLIEINDENKFRWIAKKPTYDVAEMIVNQIRELKIESRIRNEKIENGEIDSQKTKFDVINKKTIDEIMNGGPFEYSQKNIDTIVNYFKIVGRKNNYDHKITEYFNFLSNLYLNLIRENTPRNNFADLFLEKDIKTYEWVYNLPTDAYFQLELLFICGFLNKIDDKYVWIRNNGKKPEMADAEYFYTYVRANKKNSKSKFIQILNERDESEENNRQVKEIETLKQEENESLNKKYGDKVYELNHDFDKNSNNELLLKILSLVEIINTKIDTQINIDIESLKKHMTTLNNRYNIVNKNN